MTHTSENTKNKPSIKMESGMVYRIELPEGLSEGENREWLEHFIKHALIKEGAVKDYEIVTSDNNFKKYLSINVRTFVDDSGFDVISSPPALVDVTPKDLEPVKPVTKKYLGGLITNLPRNQKSFTEKCLRWVAAMIAVSPLFLLEVIRRLFVFLVHRCGFWGQLIVYLFLCNIIRHTCIYFGINYKLWPFWVKFFLWGAVL